MIFYENYLIDTDGNIFSIRSKKYLKRSYTPTGYPYCQGSYMGKKVYLKPHRLVAIAFLENPNGFNEVNHKDLNKDNCNVNNLEWCDRSFNIKHAYENNARSAVGINNARCLSTEDTVKNICELLSKGLKSSEIRDLGFKYSLVRKIKNKDNWVHISKDYKW